MMSPVETKSNGVARSSLSPCRCFLGRQVEGRLVAEAGRAVVEPIERGERRRDRAVVRIALDRAVAQAQRECRIGICVLAVDQEARLAQLLARRRQHAGDGVALSRDSRAHIGSTRRAATIMGSVDAATAASPPSISALRTPDRPAWCRRRRSPRRLDHRRPSEWPADMRSSLPSFSCGQIQGRLS